MQDLTLFSLLAFVSARADHLVSNDGQATMEGLVDRVVGTWPLQQAALDRATLGKAAQAVTPNHRPHLSCAMPRHRGHAAVSSMAPRAAYLPQFRGEALTSAGYWPGDFGLATLIRPIAHTPVAWSMPAHGHDSTAVATTAQGNRSFVKEMRVVAMKLHTREQAPKGEAQVKDSAAPRKFEPTREGYLSFLVESKVVFDTLEGVMAEAPHPIFENFQNTGLERGPSLERDIADIAEKYNMEVPVANADGPGMTYAATLKQLAADDPPAFMCHFYNQYFAHTAGGRMIGKKVYDTLFDGKPMGAFYQYDTNMGDALEGVRNKIDATADDWSREQKDHCLEETSKSFQYGGTLLKCIMGGQ